MKACTQMSAACGMLAGHACAGVTALPGGWISRTAFCKDAVRILQQQTSCRLQSFPGHKDAVSGLAFREGTHELFSASLDRTVKVRARSL